MWCASARRQSQLLAAPSRSEVLPLNRSALSVTWAFTSTATLAPPPTYEELLCVALFRCITTTSSFTSLCYQRLLPLSRCLARPLQARLRQLRVCRTSNDASRPYSTLQFAWCSDFTDALAILHWLRLPERVNFKLALMAYRV